MRPTDPLASVRNPRIAAIAALRDARARRETGRIVVDGGREIGRALAAGIRAHEIVVAESGPRGAEAEAALAAADGAGVPRLAVTAELLGRLAFGDRDDGILLVADAPRTDPAGLRLPAGPLIGVVEGVEKPGNLGAILRSADGAGVDALIVADPRADPWNPNAIRASIGTVFHVPIAVCDGGTARALLAAAGVRVVATRVDGAVPYTAADLTGGVAIALGSEADGLSAGWSGPDVTAVAIPMCGIADSLNVSVSAALLFYEALRQRTAPGGRGGGGPAA